MLLTQNGKHFTESAKPIRRMLRCSPSSISVRASFGWLSGGLAEDGCLVVWQAPRALDSKAPESHHEDIVTVGQETKRVRGASGVNGAKTGP